MYYSLPAYGDNRPDDGWAVGIAESRDLTGWTKTGEVLSAAAYERKGLAAPFALVHQGKVHLFYQTYGNGKNDAICHAVSSDGLHFTRDETNPIFHPTGSWTAGRAIDAEVARFHGRWFLYGATRDPEMKVQMAIGATSAKGFARADWKQIGNAPLLKPEFPWEGECIEAPTTIQRGGYLYMFYAGAYNNAPQQIGVARSRDGVHWERHGAEPFFPVGKPGEWNSSESGHPCIFRDNDGKTYLFYQGNPDNGKTWLISWAQVGWKNGWPYVIGR